jgi:hypothetical protein
VRGDLIVAQNQTSPTGVNPAWARLALGTTNYVLTSNGTDAIWAPVAAGGCSPPGTDTGVLSEHPAGTCYDSLHWTWNDATASSTVNGQIMLVGDGTNTVAAPASGLGYKEVLFFGENNSAVLSGSGSGSIRGNYAFGSSNFFNTCQTCFALGDSNALGESDPGSTSLEIAIGSINILGQGVLYSFGDINVVNGNEVVVIGHGSDFNASGASTHLESSILAEFEGTIALGGVNSQALDLTILGSFDTFNVGSSGGAGVDQLNCIHGVGGSNLFTVNGGGGATGAVIQAVDYVGKNNSFTVSTGDNMSRVDVAGSRNTLVGSVQTAGVYGELMTLTACTDCYALGENVTLTSADNASVNIGMSAAPEIKVKANQVTFKKLAFASLPACATGTEGSLMPVTNSTTATWGATITGGGANHVLAYCDGTNWTVAAS